MNEMKEYRYSEIEPGMAEQFEKVLTPRMMADFAWMTGDNNPLHREEKFAKAYGFKTSVAYGMLVASLYSTLVGMYLPGKYCLLHQVDTKFRKPVYPSDRLTVRGEVVEKNDLFRQVIIKAEIRNQEGERVSTAKIQAEVLESGEA